MSMQRQSHNCPDGQDYKKNQSWKRAAGFHLDTPKACEASTANAGECMSTGFSGVLRLIE